VGAYALLENQSDGNTAVGGGALSSNHSGSLNTALGQNAGRRLQSESNNIDIGANVEGVTGESNTIRIGNTDITDTFISGISGTTVASGAAVLVDSDGHLGTVTSSKRFKEEIRPMNKTSEAIFSLEPVAFRYKKEIDPAGTSQFGLIAEEVAKVNPALAACDKEGKPYTVRYEAVNAMLLNEFLKEHRKVEKLEAALRAVNERLVEQAAQIQKVSAQLEVKKPAPQVAESSQ
jgi:trimeric autotransporter adhesin